MQVSVETVSDIERRMTVGVPASRVDAEVQKRLQRAAQTARLDGFRPGKIPMKVVKQRFGAGVRQEVVSEIMRESLYEALQQEKLNPAGAPAIEPKNTEAGQDLEYTASFEVFPDIELADISELKVERLDAQVEETDIDNMIEQLRNQQTHHHEVERAAQEGDQVVIDFAGTMDGEAFQGGTAADHSLILGSNSMIEGFEAGIIGLVAGDEKVMQLKFPDEYHAQELAGRNVEFSVTLKKVSEPHVPELDEKLFALFGVQEGGLEAFRDAVRKNMERELNKAVRDRLKNQVIDGLLAAHELSVPKALISQETQRMRQEMVQQYGNNQQLDSSILPDELFADQSKKRVQTGLLINQYIQDHSLQVDDNALSDYLNKFAESYEDPEEVISYIKQDQQQLAHFQSLALEDKVIDRMLEQVQITDVKSSYEDALKQPAAPTPVESETSADETGEQIAEEGSARDK